MIVAYLISPAEPDQDRGRRLGVLQLGSNGHTLIHSRR